MRHFAWIGIVAAAGMGMGMLACGGSGDDSGSSTGYPADGLAGGAGSGGSGGAGSYADAGGGAYAGSGGGTAGTGGAAGSGGSAGNTGETGGSAGADRPPEDAGADPDAGVSCADLDPSKPEVLYLSTDDSNSMASPAIARRIIQRQTGLVPSGVVRTYEFLNYYNVPFEPAAPGELRIVPQMRPSTEDTDMELQIGVQAAPALTPRRPLTITFVLDTSGSMSGSPIELEIATVRAVAASLRAGDVISAVTWNTSNNVLLSGHVAVGPNDPGVINLANSLGAGGGTDLHGGLVAGYQLAEQHYGSDRINRIMLVSDGQANVGLTDENLIGEKADDENKEGIYMVGVGVGEGVNDTLMNVVTDAGNGAYVYIDSADEAQKMFGGRFAETMDVGARAVQVKVSLPWYFQMYKFHGEQYSGDPTKVKPQHLAPGDSMVFHQILRACASSEIKNDDAIEFTANWLDPFTYAEKTTTTTATLEDLLAGQDMELKRGRAIVAYAEALKLIPGETNEQRKQTIDGALAVVDEALAAESSSELLEIKQLLEQYRQITTN